MNLLVQVGKSTWVDPDAIKAIEWSSYYDCPKILLGGQQYVYAFNFKDHGLDNREARTGELIAFLRQVVRKTPAGVRHSSTGVNDDAAWV